MNHSEAKFKGNSLVDALQRTPDTDLRKEIRFSDFGSKAVLNNNMPTNSFVESE